MRAGGLTLPLGVTNTYYIPTAVEKAARTRQQAAALAQKQLREREEALFAAAEFSEISRQAGVRDGQYTITATYTCRENIASEVPLSAIPAPAPTQDE